MSDVHPLTGKPILQNEDGSFSTEETTTIEQDGRWYNIPTIVNGERKSVDDAVDLFRQGKNQAVGDYATQIEAEAYAKERSARLGRNAQPIPSIDSTVNYTDEGAANAAEFDANVKATDAQNNYSWGDFGRDLWDDNTTVNLARNFAAPGDVDDPSYTDKMAREDFEAMQKVLPEDWWSDFHGIGSRAEFERKFATAKNRFDAQQRFVQQGWLGFSAKLLTDVIDPSNLALSFGIAAPAFRIAKTANTLRKLGQLGQRGIQAGVGAAVGASAVGAYDVSGGHPADMDYLYAAGLGAVIGGAFGPLAKNPATSDIAASAVTIGQKAVNTASRAMKRTAEPVPEPRTTPLKDVPDVAPTVEKAPPIPEVEGFSAKSLSEGDYATYRNLIRARQIASGEEGGLGIGNDLKRTAELDEKILAFKQRFATQAEPAAEVPRTYREVRQLEDRPADLKNERYVARYEGADGNEYVIRATKDGDAVSGPYEVMRLPKDGKPGEFIARDLEGMKPSVIAERFIPREVDAQPLPKELPTDPTAIQARLDEIDSELEMARKANDDGTLDDHIDELRQEAIDLEAQLNDLEAPDGLPAGIDAETLRDRILNIRETMGGNLDEDTAQQIDAFVSQVQEQIAARNAAPADAGAAVNTGPIAPTFADNNPGLRALRDEDVPYPARPLWLPRFDISGRWGNTRNAAARLINRYLYNDPVGYSDHSKAVPSADLTKARFLEKWQHVAFVRRIESFNDWADAMGYGPAQRLAHGQEYRRLLSDAVETPDDLIAQLQTAYTDRLADGSLSSANLQRAADALLKDAAGPRKAFEDIIQRATAAQLQGAAEASAAADGKYLPHAFSWRNIQALTKRGGPLGGNGLRRLVYGAIKEAQPTLNDHYLNRLADGYTKNILSRAYMTGEDEWTIAMRTGDRDRFVALLRSDTNLADNEIDEIMQHLWDLQPEKSGVGNLKRRVLLDVNHTDADTGLPFKSILERDFDLLFMPYANRFAGRITLANMQIRAPIKPRFKTVETRNPDGTSAFSQVPDGFTGGDVLFEGVKSDGDLRRLYDMVDRWGAEYTARGGDDLRRETGRDLDRMKWGVERILGYPDPAEHTDVANYMRAWRDFQHSRLMWQGGVAQLGESGNVIGTFGVRATLDQVPALRDAMKHSGDPAVSLTLRDELHELGIGSLNHHNLSLPMDSADGLPFNVEGRSRFDTVRSYLSLGPKITNKFALQSAIQRIQEVWVSKLMAQKIADAGYKLAKGKALTASERHRFAQLTLDESDLQAIYQQLKQHTGLVDRSNGAGKVASLNLRNWDNTAARVALEESLYRASKKMIQATNLGNMAVWMTKPIAKTIFQFRQFTFSAWGNSLLYNLHMRDFPAMMSFMWSLGVAGAVRGSQVYATASLMDERQARKYRERNLTTDALFSGAFQRTSQASIIPAIADTAWLAVGQKPLFDARFSQQPTDFITGAVPFTYAKQLFQGVGGTIDSIATGRRISQAELKALQQSLPLATFLPWSAAFSHMISGQPERAPKMD